MKCLELYSGIGGFSVVAERIGWHVARAIDINQLAASVYMRNFNRVPDIRTIESLSLGPDETFDLWWMSPPCQPFTRRGAGRGKADARTQSFLHVLKMIAEHRPKLIALENVPEFAQSRTSDELRHTLNCNAYRWCEFELCSTDFGLPNRRKRFFVAASRVQQPRHLTVETRSMLPLDGFLDSTEQLRGYGTSLYPPREMLEEYREAIDFVDPNAHTVTTVTSCFTSAYGKSPVRSGSLLRQNGIVRRFSPREILKLLGFPNDFDLPSELTLRQQWKLAGNSLSLPCVEHVAKCLVPKNSEPTFAPRY